MDELSVGRLSWRIFRLVPRRLDPPSYFYSIAHMDGNPEESDNMATPRFDYRYIS